MRHVETVLGPIPADRLGHTQFHEHLICDLTRKTRPGAELPGDSREEITEITLENYYRVRREHPPINLRLDDREVAAQELALYAEAGGRTIVDATSIGLGRDPLALRELAERTGVNVVMGCGYYWSDYHPLDLADRGIDDIARTLIEELVVGVDGTGIRAGVIGEIGLGWPIHPVEERMLRAAVRAQIQTDAGILIHPGHHVDAPLAIMSIIEDEGGDPSRVVMGHLDRTLFRLKDMLLLARTGCYLEFDLFGQEMSHYPFAGLEAPVDMPNDATRVDYLVALVERGHLDRLIIAQDVCNKTSLRHYGGEGYVHILEHVIPLMRRKGLNEQQILTITQSNPRRALTGEPFPPITH